MTADAHVPAEPHFAGRGRRKRCSENQKTKREPSKQFPNDDKVMRFHEAIPLASDNRSSRAIAVTPEMTVIRNTHTDMSMSQRQASANR